MLKSFRSELVNELIFYTNSILRNVVSANY